MKHLLQSYAHPSAQRQIGKQKKAAQRKAANPAHPVQASAAVVQRKDDYYPSGDKEPHVHIHDGGVTYTGVGHSHRDLQAGDQVRENVILEVYQDLQALGTERAQQIIAWIQGEFGIDPPEEVEEEAYYDENLPEDWVEQETADHNPEGEAPVGFSYGAHISKLK